MQIPESFLKSEVREGFYITAKMKRCWASIIEVLNEISIICNRHNLKWWMDWGTLLGQVRCGGFIPWDDDLDISMMREDYMKFLDYAKEELPEGYSLANVYEKTDCTGSITRVVNSEVVTFNEDFLEKNHGFPYINGVDIMVIDYVARDEKRDKKLCELISRLHNLAESIEPEWLYKDVMKVQPFPEYLKGLERDCHKTFNKTRPIAQQLEILGQDLMETVSEDEADMAASMGAHATRETFGGIFPKEYYKELIMMPFEFYEVPVPLHYDYKMKKIFGNYMQPYRGGGTHEYPVYSRQEKLVFEKIGKRAWPAYTYSAEDLYPKISSKVEIESSQSGNSSQDNNNNQDKKTDSPKDSIEKGKDKMDIVFLITKASNWVFMLKEYNKAVENPENQVYVIPIPYYYRTNTMNIGEEIHYEGAELANYVEITGFDKYDFYGRNPDIVYFDNPYDLYDAHLAAYPMFNTERIRFYAKKMVYVSCILVDEYDDTDEKAKKMMQYCICTPGVARADEVIVQSENIRQRYIDALTEWAGEDTKSVWEEKVRSGGMTQEDLEEYPKIADEELGEEWLTVLNKPDGSRKKVILFYTSISALIENSKIAIEKLKGVFQLFKENVEDVIVYYHPDSNIFKYLENFNKPLFDEYNEVVQQFISEDYGIYDDGDDDYFMVRLCDAFYGDNGTTMYHCMRAKKPVMAMNYEIEV